MGLEPLAGEFQQVGHDPWKLAPAGYSIPAPRRVTCG